jgi:hypothetical protein
MLAPRPPLIDGSMQALQFLECRTLIPRSALGVLALHPTSGPAGLHVVKLKNGSGWGLLVAKSDHRVHPRSTAGWHEGRGRGDERQERGGDGQHGGLGGGHAKQLVLDESSRAKRTWVYENLLVSESLHRTNPGGSACRHVARGETDNDEQHSCPAERNRIERRDTKEQPGQ